MTITIPLPASTTLLTYEQYRAEDEIVARYEVIHGARRCQQVILNLRKTQILALV